MPKVLICASTAVHIRNFHLPYLKYFKDRGIEVHVAVPDPAGIEYADYKHAISMAKSFFSRENIKAIRQLAAVIRENRFDLIITHTALAAAVCRAAVMLAGKGKSKVINTVHGYLFWEGCGLLRKLVYYLPELFLRGVTDCIVAMNEEDAYTARRLVKRGGLVEKVPGMGVDASRFAPATCEEKQNARRELNIPDGAFVIVYPAEFSARKNHLELMMAMTKITDTVPEALLLLCGSGALQSEIEHEAERFGIRDNVRFLGWQGKMESIYTACDMAVSTSRSEGLPFNIVEAQMCALPVVASRIRGHVDLIQDGVTGFLYPYGNPAALAEAVINVIRSTDHASAQGLAALETSSKYSLTEAFRANIAVYEKVLEQATD